MTSDAHLWQEPFQLYPTIISEFLSAGSYGRRWPTGKGDRTAGQGQSYCTVLNLLLSIHHRCPNFKLQTLSLQQKLQCKKHNKMQQQMQWRADAAHPVLYFYGVLYSRIAIILLASLCLKDEGRGESGCWEKHRPEKIHFNLPNASAGLLTFSNWYFPWNSIVSLHNSIIEPHLIDSDYTQQDCSHGDIWVYISPLQCIWESERIKQTDRCSTSSAGRGNKRRRQFPSPLD